MTGLANVMMAVAAGLCRAGWRIDRDYICDGDAVGVHNRYFDRLTSTGMGELAGLRFRMRDDDGEVYYGGSCTPGTEFQPLDDYGMPNAGCTSIEYRIGGEWRVL